MGKTNNVRFYFKSDVCFFLFAAPLFPLALELLTLFVGHFHELVLKRSIVAEMVMNRISMFAEPEPKSSEKDAAQYE